MSAFHERANCLRLDLVSSDRSLCRSLHSSPAPRPSRMASAIDSFAPSCRAARVNIKFVHSGACRQPRARCIGRRGWNGPERMWRVELDVTCECGTRRLTSAVDLSSTRPCVIDTCVRTSESHDNIVVFPKTDSRACDPRSAAGKGRFRRLKVTVPDLRK